MSVAADRATTVQSLAAALPDGRVIGDGAAVITEIVYDSRQVEPGYLFAALPGGYADGHDYAAQAVARGAAAVLVERVLEIDVPQIVVADSRAALAPLSAEFFGHPSRELGVIGVTGTDGKTTTTFLIDAIMRRVGKRTGLVGTVAIRIGASVDFHSSRQTTPESVDVQRYLRAMAAAGAEWAILEATSHALPQHRLDNVVFQIGAVTNITHEHLDYHKTIAGYRRAKAILFERVADFPGTAVVNIDDEGAREMLCYVGDSDVTTYSPSGANADLRALDIEMRPNGTRFRLATAGREPTAVSMPLIGQFNVANALCATGVALAAGIPLTEIVAALAKAPAVPGRMERVDRGQPFQVVVDYAHTPESLAKILATLRALNPGGRVIAVFGSAGERDIEKRAKQGAVAQRDADFNVFTTEDPRFEDPDAIIAAIADGARAAGGREGETFSCVTDRRQAIAQAFAVARPGDCVLLAGKGHEGSIIWGQEKRPWNEARVAHELLSELGYEGSQI